MAKARRGKPAKGKTTRAKPTKARTTKSKRKPAKPSKPRKPPRKPPSKPARVPPPVDNRPIEDRLIDALELAQDIARDAGYDTKLDIKKPPSSIKTKTLWILVGRYIFKDEVAYGDLFDVLRAWERSSKLEHAIHPQRLSRIRVDYVPMRGKTGEYTLAETGPWEMVVSRARSQCNAENEDSLASRYADTRVESLYVWLSAQLATEVTIAL